MLKLGVIGLGSRMSGIVKLLLASGEVQLTAVTDPDIEKVKSSFDAEVLATTTFYSDAEEMLQKEKLDGVCIGTRCSTHTQFALLVAKYNLPMFLEKPVCTTEEDLAKLETIRFMSEKTVVSFPLRLSHLLKTVKEIVDSGKIGTIEHVQAYNNVPYARGYFHKWYRDENETGGLFLQKSTHDLDYINYLLGDNRPVRICAMNSKQIFKGDMPAGMKCKDCEKAETCTESPQNVTKSGEKWALGEYCCFAVDTGNEDSGSCIIEYESGMHVVYTQNFIVRKDAGKRGARLIGYKGTLEFDWVSNEIKVFRHLEAVNEHYTFGEGGGSHFGGDNELVANFISVMKGTDVSHATLEEGILSAKMCLMAKKSAKEHIFCDI